MGKQELRKQFIEKRQAIAKHLAASKSARICARLASTPEFAQATRILFYFPVRGEVDCLPALKKALEKGKKVFLPSVRQGKIMPVEVKNAGELENPEKMRAGTFGIPEPHGKTARLEEIDLVVVPGVAFDSSGSRLGYGKGYYDAFLKRLSKGVVKIGVCFEECLAKQLPEEGHDQKVDIVVTESKVMQKVKK